MLRACMHRLRLTARGANALRRSLLAASDRGSRTYLGDPPSMVQPLVVDTEHDALSLKTDGLEAIWARCDLSEIGGLCFDWREEVAGSLWLMKVDLLHWPPTFMPLCSCGRH